MPDHAASQPIATPAPPQPSASGSAPLPVRPAAMNPGMRTRWLAVLDRSRMAMTPLRRAMRRTARHQ
jgi:hypothetical protein